jgi:hypothetical protein
MQHSFHSRRVIWGDHFIYAREVWIVGVENAPDDPNALGIRELVLRHEAASFKDLLYLI